MRNGKSLYVNRYCGGTQIPTSAIREKHVVFGGADRLREEIKSAQGLLDAKLFVVTTGCMTEMIKAASYIKHGAVFACGNHTLRIIRKKATDPSSSVQITRRISCCICSLKCNKKPVNTAFLPYLRVIAANAMRRTKTQKSLCLKQVYIPDSIIIAWLYAYA